jgi:hypothetical protein
LSLQNTQSTDESAEFLLDAVDDAMDYIVASQLAWRSALAKMVVMGDISFAAAADLTSRVIADTQTLTLGGEITVGRTVTSLKSEIGMLMRSNISDQFSDIADKYEEQNNAV